MGVAQIPDNIADPAILPFSGFDGSLGLVRIEAMVGLIRNAVPVDLGLSGRPDRNISINRLNLAILRAGRPVILIAEGLARFVVAAWAEYEQPISGAPVCMAMLIDPPDVRLVDGDRRLAGLCSFTRAPLPFPAKIVARAGCSEAEVRGLRHLAGCWECGVVREEEDFAFTMAEHLLLYGLELCSPG